MSRPCTAGVASRGYEKCGQPAVAAVTVGCVHEHINDVYWCSEHAEDGLTKVCRDCRRAGYRGVPLHELQFSVIA